MTTLQQLLSKLKTSSPKGANHLAWVNEKVLKHEEDKDEKEITLSGYRIAYRRPYEILHTYKELFEKGIYQFSPPVNNPLIIDCGANIGLSVLYFKMLYPNAGIIAFEPDAGNFALLEKNVRNNNLTDVTLHNAAVWIHNDTIHFASSGSEASHISAEPVVESVSVKAFRLADLLQQHSTVAFLKIDIEGAEEAVLKDCANSLDRVQNLFLEYHGKTKETQKLNTILGIIQNAGFSTYVQNAADLLSHPYISKTTGGLYDVQLNIFCFRA
jgi:FkbM family methyltransferase